ncbi:MAG: phosphate uptake regulator PhoU [Nitrospiraceae bacterium]
MSDLAERIKESLDSPVRGDVHLAQNILRDDVFVDALMGQPFRELLSCMREDPRTVSHAIRLTFDAKSFERVADHTTSIAELVVYPVGRRINRHMAPHSAGSWRRFATRFVTT